MNFICYVFGMFAALSLITSAAAHIAKVVGASNVLTIALVILWGVVVFVGMRRWERSQWNNGHCKQCGHTWRYFDTDSQGGRLYACRGSERHNLSLSWIDPTEPSPTFNAAHPGSSHEVHERKVQQGPIRLAQR